MTSSQPDLDRLLHAVADPTRRRILEILREPAAQTKVSTFAQPPVGQSKKGLCLCAGDIEEQIRLSQPTISHHMTILTNSGLVDAVKQGQWRWYRRNTTAIRRLLKLLRTKL
ncbi:MAG TPA: metalloregulator ArsR/SmtB family transcription factor [Candidatus Sulfotelmatobacter sp.]